MLEIRNLHARIAEDDGETLLRLDDVCGLFESSGVNVREKEVPRRRNRRERLFFETEIAEVRKLHDYGGRVVGILMSQSSELDQL